MTISDLSIRRPVFATVLSLLLIILGLMAANRLAVREYPDISRPVITVDTSYRGASAAVMESRITQVLEDQLAGIEGVDKLTSSSRDESSRISIEFSLDRDLDAAANDVRDRVSRVLNNLPLEADPPQISKVADDADPVMVLNVSSEQRTPLELTDYAERYLVDRFSTVSGVAQVRVGGGRRYAMRLWLSREALAARQLTVADIETSLRNENVELPAGRLESNEREFTLRTDTGLRSEQDFRNLVVGRGADGYLVRLGEVAKVELAPEDVRSISRSDGKPGISMLIVPNSKANLLDVAHGTREMLARVQPDLPKDMILDINMDLSIFVLESMKKVVEALGETLVLVLVVIFLFLGSLRATLIPAVTIPVSIVSAAIVMALAGFSINVLTLLGLVLAIGLVVDDAIVVLENIVRRIEQGEPALLAAMNGSREIAFAVIATTLVLIAVFVPLSYLQGNIGRLFGEFGVTLAAAVGFSALVALTLTPMMASKFFSQGIRRGRLAAAVDRFFKKLAARYEHALRAALRRPLLVTAAAVAALLVAVLLYFVLPKEYTPTEDRAMLRVSITAPEGASVEYRDRYVIQVEAILLQEIARGNARRVLVRSGTFGRGSGDVNTAMLIMPLSPWNERQESATEMAQRLRQSFSRIPGVRVAVVQPSSLAVRGAGNPVQIVLGGGEYEQLVEWRDKVLARAAGNPGLTDLDSDYYSRKPQVNITVDRNRAADLGVSLGAVGRTLETMLGSRIVTTFLDRGEEYNVILQARPEERATVNDLTNIYVRSEKSGALIPIGSLVNIEERAGPIDLKRFNRLRAITISAGIAPGYSLGEAIDALEKIVREEMPPEMNEGGQINYDGETREYKLSGGALYFTFLLALVIVFLLLAAQFESFLHPLVILMTVPLAITGALIGLWLFGQSLNVFSQIGAIMLIGIAAKNGILIVEFSNQLRDRGREFLEAIVEASVIRLRPVLMTSLCTAFGALPLLLAYGAGAESRRAIGAAVFFGVTFAVALTLFVVPAFYALIARNTRSPEHVARAIDKLRSSAKSLLQSREG